ncbi:MAG TPA: radical SAM protein [Myxococcota bacterium]|nr:radical SAM protein [Myxococcota bacterium]
MKAPAVLLISPGILRWVDGDFGLPHLVALGGYLREHTGVRVEIIDLNYEGGDHQSLLKTLNDLSPLLCIGVSVYSSFDFTRVKALARFLKKAMPGVPLIAGGYHASALPGDLEPFDSVVQGEGERPMTRVVETLLGGGVVEPLYPHDLVEDLDTLPPYAWDLLDRYWPKALQLGRKLQIYFSRGCPYHCTFCMERAKSGYSWRAYSVERALDELRRLGTFTPLERWVVNVADPLFGFQRSWRRELLDGIATEGLLPRQFWTLTRSDDLEAEDVKLLAEARFSIGIGLETGSPRMHGVMQKGNTPERYLSAIRRLARLSQDNGLTWATNIIVGHPGETPESLRETRDFVEELFLGQPTTRGWLSVDPFRLYPGSQVHEQMQLWEEEHGSRFHQPRWWRSWYDGPFRAEHLDPSRELDFEARVRWMGEAYPPLLESIRQRFVSSGREVDRIYRMAMDEQVANLSPERLQSVLQKARSVPRDAGVRIEVPIGLALKDPWVRRREAAVRRLLDRGVLRTAELVEALLQEKPEHWMPPEQALRVLAGEATEPHAEGALPESLGIDAIALGLEALGPLRGQRVADLGAASGYLAALLCRLVGEGEVLALSGLGDLQAMLPRARVVEPHALPLPEEELDAAWLGAAMPRLPAELRERVDGGMRLVTLLGPRFRAQDLVLLTAHGEQRLGRVKAPVMGGRWGWVPLPAAGVPADLRFVRWPGPAQAYHVLAHLDLGADAAGLYDPELPSRPWVEPLRRAYAEADRPLVLQGKALRHRTVPALLADLRSSGDGLQVLFADAIESEGQGTWPELEEHAALSLELRHLAGLLWQHRPPPLRLLDCPSLGRHGRAGWLDGERIVAVNAAEDPEHVLQQVLHEWVHTLTDSLVEVDHARRDTRLGSEGFQVHAELERVALLATEAMLSERAPEHLPGFRRWLERVL